MKTRLLELIVCPKCGEGFECRPDAQQELSLSPEQKSQILALRGLTSASVEEQAKVLQSYQTDIVTGRLICTRCESVYPIEAGIPRILGPELRTQSGSMGRVDPGKDVRIESFMDQMKPIEASNDPDRFLEVQLANQSNYGYEWKAFKHQYDQWEEVYTSYYCQENLDNFRGKLGVDCGCGMGRYSLVPVSRGAEVVGVDLSNAVDSAYEKSQVNPMFHVVQGDIFNLPLRKASFDFAQSLGVVHITPDPLAASKSVASTVKSGGKVYFMVYSSFEDDNLLKYFLLKPITLVRQWTVRLPSDVLYRLLAILTPFIIVFCYFPSWLLHHIPFTRGLSEKLPYNYAQYGKRRWRDIHMNLFDRFGNPVERRYNRKEMITWMDQLPFSDYKLDSHDGWIVTATKSMAQTT